MKKHLSIIAIILVLATSASAQISGFIPYKSKNEFIGLAADSLFYGPVKDTNFTPARKGALTFRTSDNRYYMAISTTAGTKRWAGMLKYDELGIDSIWRIAGIDSIYFSKSGTTYSFLDSTGSGSTYIFTAPLIESSGTVSINGLSGYGTSGQIPMSTGTGWTYFTPTYVSTRDRFGRTGEDTVAAADRHFSGKQTYSFYFDSLTLYIRGIFGAGTTISNYNESQFFFNPRKAATRGGYDNANNWWNANVGDYSTGFGYKAVASNTGTVAMGYQPVASGSKAIAMGDSPTAAAASSISFGPSATVISGADYGISIGGSTTRYLYGINIGTGNVGYNLAGINIGLSNIGRSDYGATLGSNLTNRWYGGTLVGMWNDSTTAGSPTGGSATLWHADNIAFAVGIGTADNARANAITVRQNGKVGIGVVYPQTTLDVLGDIRFKTGSPAIGDVWTATSTDGDGEWAAPAGGGNTNSNVGSGFRLAIPGTNDIKTLRQGSGIIIDSTVASNEIEHRVDTVLIATTKSLNDTVSIRLAELGEVIVETDLGSPSATASGLDLILPAWVNGANITISRPTDSTIKAEVTGTLPIANGGTNNTATPGAGQVAYGDGSKITYSNSGSDGQVIRYKNSAPTWVYDTTTLASFGAGSGAAGDTAVFSTSALYGSFFNDSYDTLYLTKVQVGLQGTSPSVAVTLYWNDSLAVTAGATKAVNAGNTCTNIYTGTSITSFDNQKIPPGVWVWLQTTTVTTKPKYLTASLIGYRKKK